MKEIYQFAINFEQKNQDFYYECAEKVENKKLKDVFEELAAEEEKHERIIRNLAEGDQEEEVDSDIVSQAREVFNELASDFDWEKDSSLPTDQVDIYKEAQELERESNKYYSEKAEETDDKEVEEVFNRLARKEKKHEEILQNIINMVNKPNTWLDDPEWYHLDEY